MKAKRIILCVAVVFLAGILAYSAIQRKHTFTLSNEDGGVKAEQIQPVFGTVKVSGDMDTDVVFTDVETGEKYTIGYITHGMTEKIKLERGRWYSVAGSGNLTVKPVSYTHLDVYKRQRTGFLQFFLPCPFLRTFSIVMDAIFANLPVPVPKVIVMKG